MSDFILKTIVNSDEFEPGEFRKLRRRLQDLSIRYKKSGIPLDKKETPKYDTLNKKGSVDIEKLFADIYGEDELNKRKEESKFVKEKIKKQKDYLASLTDEERKEYYKNYKGNTDKFVSTKEEAYVYLAELETVVLEREAKLDQWKIDNK